MKELLIFTGGIVVGAILVELYRKGMFDRPLKPQPPAEEA